MKKFLVLCLLLPILLFASCPSQPKGEDSLPGSTGNGPAYDYFIENELTVGWNLGNNLDAHSDGTGNETAWGNPAINQTLMNGIKAAGFNLIRIPITWMGHIGPAPDYTVTEARLNRVKEVVDMANNAGLKVIINIHHDDKDWLSIKRARENAGDKTQITARFSRLWEQIANHFRDYGEWLIFESMNEIQDGGWAWSADFRTTAGVRAQFDILNEWNQVFTDKVRGSGGNNASRFLVIPSYAANPECTLPGGRIKDHPVANIGNNFKLPVDSAKGRQIVSFHYYKPENVGLGGGSNRPARSNWGNGADKTAIDSDLKPFKAAYIDKGIPVIIGECGASRQLYPSNAAKEAQARESRKAYLSYMFAAAKKYGLVPVYWDNGSVNPDQFNGESFGLFNRSTGEPISSEVDEFKNLVEAMINAVK